MYFRKREDEMRKYYAAAITIVLVVAFVASGWAGMKMKKGMMMPGKWRSFIHVKSMVIPDKSHGLYGFHHIYVNRKGLETLKKGGAYPEGSVFIGAFYDVVTEKDGSIHQGKKLYTVYMKKDAKAKETGGWSYAAFDPEGKLFEKDYKKECYDCHTGAKDTDFVFSKLIE